MLESCSFFPYSFKLARDFILTVQLNLLLGGIYRTPQSLISLKKKGECDKPGMSKCVNNATEFGSPAFNSLTSNSEIFGSVVSSQRKSDSAMSRILAECILNCTALSTMIELHCNVNNV
jgi:hypothetical protein